ncbi:MAG: PAS domain-containing hybrid sensor histidine kinase/response regulator [Desulfonatronovibrionaceae bacterium]
MPNSLQKPVLIIGPDTPEFIQIINILQYNGYTRFYTVTPEETLPVLESEPHLELAVMGTDVYGPNQLAQPEKITNLLDRRFRLVFEHSPLGLLQTDDQGVIIDCNHKFVEIIGSSRNKLLGLNLLNLPDAKLVKEVKKALQGLTGFYQDVYRSVSADKETPVRVHLAPLFNHKNQVTGCVGITEDMTLQQESENQLRKSREALGEKNSILQGILDNIPDTMSVKDTELNVIMCNKAGYEFFGIDAMDLQGKKCYQLLNRASPCNPCAGLQAARTKRPAVNEKYVPELDRYLSCQANPVTGSDGRVKYIVELIRDITLQKQKEKELLESQERFAKAFQSSPAPQVISDIRSGKIIEVNDQWVQMLGWSREEQVGRTSSQLGIWKYSSERDKVIQLLENQGYCKEYPVELITRDKQIIMVLLSAEFVTVGGRQVMLSMIYDQTEQKKAEQEKEKLQAQLLHSQKMESMGILAGGVAHDFNNLLQTMGGNIQLLLRDKTSEHPDYSRLSSTMKSIDRAASLIRQLLIFSRKEDARISTVNLNKEIEQAVEILERTIPRMVRIKTRLNDQLCLIQADAVQMEQVLLNLGFNAADAMPQGGELIIETDNTEIRAEDRKARLDAAPGPYVVMTITDTGQGMDKETRKHIFEPFFTTKETGKGTGLGLASVYGIIKSHNGLIFCYSEPGQGTSFRIYLPADKEACHLADEIEKHEKTLSGSETVMVVDDESEIREITCEILEGSGYTTISAASGEEALSLYAEEPQAVDLVVLDLNMPGMGGQECLKRILELNPEARVVIVSGYSECQAHNQNIISKASGYISKPYQLGHLLASIRAVLDLPESGVPDSSAGQP